MRRPVHDRRRDDGNARFGRMVHAPSHERIQKSPGEGGGAHRVHRGERRPRDRPWLEPGGGPQGRHGPCGDDRPDGSPGGAGRLAAGRLHLIRHQGTVPHVRGGHRPLPPGQGGLRLSGRQDRSRGRLDQPAGFQPSPQPQVRGASRRSGGRMPAPPPGIFPCGAAGGQRTEEAGCGLPRNSG